MKAVQRQQLTNTGQQHNSYLQRQAEGLKSQCLQYPCTVSFESCNVCSPTFYSQTLEQSEHLELKVSRTGQNKVGI